MIGGDPRSHRKSPEDVHIYHKSHGWLAMIGDNKSRDNKNDSIFLIRSAMTDDRPRWSMKK